MANLYFQRAAGLGLVQGEQPFTRPPKPRHVPRFLIPAGSPCVVRKVTSAYDWRAHRTRKDLAFERFERYERAKVGSFWSFRHTGWIIRVNRQHVVLRADVLADVLAGERKGH